MKRKHKQYFVYYIKDNILIFDIFDYIEELAASYVDYCYEWHLVKDNIVSDKTCLIKDFFEKKYKDINHKILSLNKELNCYFIFYYQKKKIYNEWSSFMKDPEIFIKKAKKILKYKFPNFLEVEDENLNLFERVKGTYENLPCLLPSGEDEHFITKHKRKLKII